MLKGIYHIDPENKVFDEMLKNAQKVGNACGLCNAVQITKDLGEFISEALQDPDEESRMVPEHGEISCNHHNKKKEQNYVCIQRRSSRAHEKAHSRDSEQRSWRSHCPKRVPFLGGAR